MNEANAGYREIPHTADWELQVWATDLPGLMKQAAVGMYALSGTRLAHEGSVVRTFEIPFLDPETLLVDFLSELLFLSEHEGIGFECFEISLGEDQSQIRAHGTAIETQAKEIKAVTFHKLQIQESEVGLTVNIVFDV